MVPYEGFLSSNQINVRLTGQLTIFDGNHERNDVDMKILEKNEGQKSLRSFAYI